MRLFGRPLSAVSGDDILRFVGNRVRESVELEYKECLPGETDGEKKEFLADVSSFANTAGGVMAFGLSSEKDEAGKNTGSAQEVVGVGNVNQDDVGLRLENLLRDGLDPRILGMSMRWVSVGEKKVFLLGIPRSLLGPHQVRYRNDSRFYVRNSSGKYQMDVREIRQAFLTSDAWMRDAETFRRSRIASIRALEFIPNLDVDGSVILHVVPLGMGRDALDLRKSEQELRTLLDPPFASGERSRFNLEGFIVHDGGQDKTVAYVQYFRHGGIEVYTSQFHVRDRNVATVKFRATSSEALAVEYSQKYLAFAQSTGVAPPFAIMLSCLDMRNLTIIPPRELMLERDSLRYDRDEIFLPAIVVEDAAASLDTLLPPVFDILWQAAGWAGSPNCKDGRWKRPE